MVPGEMREYMIILVGFFLSNVDFLHKLGKIKINHKTIFWTNL